jgi:hypothetical protein
MNNLLCHPGRIFTLDELDGQAAPDMPREFTESLVSLADTARIGDSHGLDTCCRHEEESKENTRCPERVFGSGIISGSGLESAK